MREIFPGPFPSSCATLLLCLSTALSQDSRYYMKGDWGGNVTANTEITVFTQGPPFFVPDRRGQVRFDPGTRAGFAGGYQVTDWFAAEAEIGATVNTFQGSKYLVPPQQVVIKEGTFANVPFLLNGKLSHPIGSRWLPFVAAGVGASVSILDADVIYSLPPTTYGRRAFSSSADVVFAYQACAGLQYKLNDRTGLGVEYRYLATDTSHFDHPTMSIGHIDTHAFSLAFTWRF